MKVLLIHPTFTALLPEDYGRPALYEPLGLGYLAAVAREAGHEVSILDCTAEGWRTREKVAEWTRVGLRADEIAARVRAFSPDVVGVTCQFTGFERDALHVAEVAKRAMPHAPVLFGGADATARDNELIANPNIDLIVRGEGERVFLDVLERYARERTLPEDAPGTTTKRRQNPRQLEIDPIDDLPLPARDLMPMDVYLEDQTPLMPYAKRRPIGFLISSRGCPYNCIFCSTTKVWKRWRPRSPENVVDEIEHLIRAYAVREIAFQDDSFLVDPERAKAICAEINRRRLDIAWTVPPGLTVNRLTDDLLRVMKDAGFYRACFPIESGDPEMLAWIRKPIDLDQVHEAIEACNKLGIWTYGNFIIGFPEQTPDSVERTAAFAANCGLDMISVYVAQPYAGSDLYDIYRDLGLLDKPGIEGSTVFNTRYDTKHFTAEQLRTKRDEIYRRFMKKRVRRLFTPKGLNDLRRKTDTPENFAYALRVFGTFLRNSLHEGRIALFGSVAQAKDEVESAGPSTDRTISGQDH